MHIFIPGDDARMQLLKEEALARGHMLTDAAHCNAGVLPLPDSGSAVDAVLTEDGHGKLLLHGRLSTSQAETLLSRGWTLKNIQEDDAYIQKNALITAEGAIFAAMQQVDFTLRDAPCAVVGYGRIARELTRLLLAMGAQVQVAARRESARLQAALAGAQVCSTERMPEAFHGIQILFNTVPSQIITGQVLSALSPGALVIELASPPYGLDMELARSMGLRVLLESGVPGRYAPRTAAKLLMNHIEAGGD